MSTFSLIGAGAVLLTIISLRWRNIAYLIGAVLAWAALLFYNFGHPMTNITLGSFQHDLSTYAILMFLAGTLVAYIYNVRRGYTGYERTASEQREYNNELKRDELESKGIMEMSDKEYREYIHRRRTGR